MNLGIRTKLFASSLGLIVASLFIGHGYDRAVAKLHVGFALAAVLALCVAVLMSSIATHVASRSVLRLTATARGMVGAARGTAPVPVDKDELAGLGCDLDLLASSLGSARAQLAQERDLLNSLLSGMREGVLVLGAAGPEQETALSPVRLCNPALRELLLLSQDPTGKPLPLQAAGNVELLNLLARTHAATHPVIGEVQLEGIKPRVLLVRATKLASEGAGILAVFVDVTELRRLESLRRDFVANVSHELRTPVTAMRSAAETIRGAAARDPEAAGRFLDIIERNGERLQHMVEELLDLSRIESQGVRMNLTDLALPELAVHLLELLHTRADQKRIRLSLDMAPELPWVRVDQPALDQVLLNLVDNAIKYCPPGSLVTVGATAVKTPAARGQRFILITVTDNGPGIAAPHLPRLFERFYRVEAGRSRELGGTGLGLAIVKHLVEAMHGEVWVESEVGKGTTFGFTVPQAGISLRTEAPADATPEPVFQSHSLTH